jgi:hypothetical protein
MKNNNIHWVFKLLFWIIVISVPATIYFTFRMEHHTNWDIIHPTIYPAAITTQPTPPALQPDALQQIPTRHPTQDTPAESSTDTPTEFSNITIGHNSTSTSIHKMGRCLQ